MANHASEFWLYTCSTWKRRRAGILHMSGSSGTMSHLNGSSTLLECFGLLMSLEGCPNGDKFARNRPSTVWSTSQLGRATGAFVGPLCKTLTYSPPWCRVSTVYRTGQPEMRCWRTVWCSRSWSHLSTAENVTLEGRRFHVWFLNTSAI